MTGTLGERLLAQRDRHGDAPFLRLMQADTSVLAFSYAQCLGQAVDWAATFAAHGASRGQRIVVILPHSLDLYAAFFGAVLGDMVPAMFAFPSPKFDEGEYFRTFGALIDNAAPSLIVCYDELAPAVRRVLASRSGPQPPVLTPADRRRSNAAPAPAASPNHVAFLQYSSGTTGTKKGVAVTHRAALWQIDAYANAIQLNDRDVIASWLPLYHDMGMVACCLLPFLTGTPVLAIAPHDWVRAPMLLPHMIGQHHATLCWLPNFAYSFMAKNIMPRELEWLNLSSLRGVINCSEPILAASHRAFLSRFATRGLRPEAIATCYAMAETTFAITSGGFGEPVREDIVDRAALARGQAVPAPLEADDVTTLVSSGRALPETTIVIRSATGDVLPDRRIGEITVSSPSLFDGYFGNPTATAASLERGVFRTGDLGYLADGHLYVTGRLKDLLIVAGRNVHPHDVEDAVNDVPGVIAGRTAAFGVADEANGTERLVVIAETAATDANERDRINRAIAAKVAGRIDVAASEIRLVAPRWLVKSTSGKMARDRNRQRYLAGLAGIDAAATAAAAAAAVAENGPGDTVVDRLEATDLDRALGCVRRVLAEAGRLDTMTIGPDDRLVTSGLIDSLTLVALVVEVEHTFGIRIPPTHLDVGHFNTARHITTLVARGREDTLESLQYANGVTTSDDRDKACERLLECANAIDLVILGSSKVKHVAPRVAAECGRNAFNFWLRNARAEDWYAAGRFALDHAPLLRSILLVVDIEGLSNSADVDLRLAESTRLRPYLADSARLAAQGNALTAAPDDRFRTVFVQYKLGHHEPWTWALSGRGERYTERVGGGADDVRARRSLRDPSDSDAQYTLRMRDFTRLDPERVGCFHRLLEHCFSRGVDVRCCLAPLHERLDRHLAAHTTYAARLSEFVALAKGIRHPLFRFFDTRTPDRFGGRHDDFVNAAHIGYDNSDRLLKHLLSDTATCDGADEVSAAWSQPALPV